MEKDKIFGIKLVCFSFIRDQIKGVAALILTRASRLEKVSTYKVNSMPVILVVCTSFLNA